MLQVAGSWVVAPAAGRPRGTVHFLGGAFAGAAPQVAYALLLQLLAEAGYTCVATPYAVTFQHLVCASAVQQARLGWLQCLPVLAWDCSCTWWQRSERACKAVP